jgi:aromatic-L-amino-acid decarboxylase
MFAASETSGIQSGSRFPSIPGARGYPLDHPTTLDPSEWHDFRAQAHRMLDDILDYTQHIRARPVWQQIPQSVRESFRQSFPQKPTDLATLHNIFMRDILPYSVGNAHPGFMGWVHGGGTPVGMLAEMLAAGLNANLAGRDQVPIEVERQVVQWVREMFGFPDTASGLFVTGTSIANLIAVLVARTAAVGVNVRRQGIAATGKRLIAYTSIAAHGCIAQAMDLAGLGIDMLRLMPVNDRYEIDIQALEGGIATDRSAGLHSRVRWHGGCWRDR